MKDNNHVANVEMSSTMTLEDAISETKNVLQPLFVKPKLSDKLLSKPPFRFIHDIIVATLKTTTFPNGFFSLEELDSSNYKDSKTAKISFLNKFIHLVNVGNGSELEVSSAKIVAGLEPLQTNILLASFGKLAKDESIDRNNLIQHCLSGKGIDEFHSKGDDSKLIDTNVSALPNSANDDVSPSNTVIEKKNDNDSNIPHSVMEQIKTCNEDMEQTRVMISGIISKPKCSDKLLSKPPFRFIHDLVTGIGKATEFDLCVIFR